MTFDTKIAVVLRDDLDIPNLILTPHMAFASIQSLETLAEQFIGNLEAYVAGEPRNLVVPSA